MRAFVSGIFWVPLLACYPEPIRLDIPVEGAGSAIVAFEREGGFVEKVAVVDAAANEGSRCAHLSSTPERMTVTAILYERALSDFCMESGCFTEAPGGSGIWPSFQVAYTATIEGGRASAWVSSETLRPGVAAFRLPPSCRSPHPVEHLVLGSAHSCVLLQDGSIWCWGTNGHGQLGIGGRSEAVTQPQRVEGVGPWVEVASGWHHTCAVDEDQGIFCWGWNAFGQAGEGGEDNLEPRQVAVAVEEGVVRQLALGKEHTCVLISDGDDDRVWCWGNRKNHQLGDGGGAPSSTPVAVPLPPRIEAITAGSLHTCARLREGTAACWGSSKVGELGSPGEEDFVPTVMTSTSQPLSDVRMLALGDRFSCALVGAGEVYCWGYNKRNQLGEVTGDQRAPVLIEGLTNVDAIVARGWVACAIRGDEVSCWGAEIDAISLGPYPVPIDANGTAFSLGLGRLPGANILGDRFFGEHACFRDKSGRIRCFGGNDFGQLGNGATNSELPPGAFVRW